MLEKVNAIEARYDELTRLLEENAQDYQRVAELAKERAGLETIVTKAQEYRQVLQRLEEARALQNTEDEELRQMALSEIAELSPQQEKLETELKNLLIPKDPRDERNVIVEIRGGTGGDEAALFAADLFRMYSYYAEQRGWTIEIFSQNEIGIGGYKEIIFIVKGRGAYSRLKYEFGRSSCAACSYHRSAGTHPYFNSHRGCFGRSGRCRCPDPRCRYSRRYLPFSRRRRAERTEKLNCNPHYPPSNGYCGSLPG